MVNAIFGLVKPSSGGIRFNEKIINTFPLQDLVKLGIVQVPEGRGIFGTLMVLENLKIGAYLNPLNKEIQQTLDQFYSIFQVPNKRKDQLGGSLNGGEQQMLAHSFLDNDMVSWLKKSSL